MSIADKLTLLINTKQDIKSAISEKGVEVTGGMTTYADAIKRIETGGGGGDSFYVPVGLKFGYESVYNSYNAPDFTLPKLILADGYEDGSYMFDFNMGLTNINGIYSTNSSLTDCRYMFRGCTKLTTIPQLETSKVTNMFKMFSECWSLTTIPQLQTSKVTNMSHMFESCKSLITIPQLQTSKVENMDYMFWKCTSLTSIPQMITSNVTDMDYMFRGCTSLTTIPQLDTSRMQHIYGMFMECSGLKSLPLLDFSNVVDTIELFDISSSSNEQPYPDLTDLGGFKNLKVNLNLSGMPNLTVQSLMNVINNLKNLNGTGLSPKTLTLGTTNLNKLTAEQKAVATNKGWVLK